MVIHFVKKKQLLFVKQNVEGPLRVYVEKKSSTINVLKRNGF